MVFSNKKKRFENDENTPVTVQISPSPPFKSTTYVVGLIFFFIPQSFCVARNNVAKDQKAKIFGQNSVRKKEKVWGRTLKDSFARIRYISQEIYRILVF